MTTFSITYDDEFRETVEKLRLHYGLPTQEAVFLRAVALLNIAARYEAEDGTLTLRGPKDRVRVKLRKQAGAKT